MDVILRNTGIRVLGSVPWGTHFCQFYRTRKDLLDILVPYFKAGLESQRILHVDLFGPPGRRRGEEGPSESRARPRVPVAQEADRDPAARANGTSAGAVSGRIAFSRPGPTSWTAPWPGASTGSGSPAIRSGWRRRTGTGSRITRRKSTPRSAARASWPSAPIPSTDAASRRSSTSSTTTSRASSAGRASGRSSRAPSGRASNPTSGRANSVSRRSSRSRPSGSSSTTPRAGSSRSTGPRLEIFGVADASEVRRIPPVRGPEPFAGCPGSD